MLPFHTAETPVKTLHRFRFARRGPVSCVADRARASIGVHERAFSFPPVDRICWRSNKKNTSGGPCRISSERVCGTRLSFLAPATSCRAVSCSSGQNTRYKLPCVATAKIFLFFISAASHFDPSCHRKKHPKKVLIEITPHTFIVEW